MQKYSVRLQVHYKYLECTVHSTCRYIFIYKLDELEHDKTCIEERPCTGEFISSVRALHAATNKQTNRHGQIFREMDRQTCYQYSDKR